MSRRALATVTICASRKALLASVPVSVNSWLTQPSSADLICWTRALPVRLVKSPTLQAAAVAAADCCPADLADVAAAPVEAASAGAVAESGARSLAGTDRFWPSPCAAAPMPGCGAGPAAVADGAPPGCGGTGAGAAWPRGANRPSARSIARAIVTSLAN